MSIAQKIVAVILSAIVVFLVAGFMTGFLLPKPADRDFIAKGLAFYNEGRVEEAMTYFNEALEINPKSAEAYNNIGLVYYDQKNYKDAIINYNKSVELDTSNIEAFIGLGFSYEGAGDKSKAKECFNKVLVIDPHEKRAKDELAKLG